ncbi:MAG: hypothetical protein KAJ29_06865 [Alphaproteobacteria bacterium]|nr:hypothetical protein [Alphaproteobacteria bacterium]
MAGLEGKRVWVVFTDQSELKYVRMLKRGFRHCFILIHDGRSWISIDPMANYMEVLVHDLPGEFDFALWLKERGHNVVEAKLIRNIMTCAPVMLFTCVEACKRILGVHKLLILTPWQLYCYLAKQSNRSIE